MKPILFILLFLLSSFYVSGQIIPDMNSNSADTIQIVKRSGNKMYFYQGRQVKLKGVKEIVQDNEKALKLINGASAQNVIAGAIAFTGGFICGYQLGMLLRGGDMSYEILGIGAGIVAISIPISVSANNDMKRGIRTYNEGVISQPKTTGRYELRIQSTGNTVGLAFTL